MGVKPTSVRRTCRLDARAPFRLGAASESRKQLRATLSLCRCSGSPNAFCVAAAKPDDSRGHEAGGNTLETGKTPTVLLGDAGSSSCLFACRRTLQDQVGLVWQSCNDVELIASHQKVVMKQASVHA